jgi:hypothetical protein
VRRIRRTRGGFGPGDVIAEFPLFGSLQSNGVSF